MDLDETFSRSELVLQGTVVTGTSGETSKGEIFTDWIIDVERTFWGPGETERTIRLPGGVLATGRGTMIPGMPRLALGEEVVLFLTDESANGMRVPVGLSQGKYRIVTGSDGSRMAVQTGDHVSLISARSTRTVDGLEMMDYADLVARIEAASQKRVVTEFNEAGEPPTSPGVPAAEEDSTDGQR
ncbi:MAG: molybdopterin-binding protein [Planctomycetota bacterium]|jgi:molybdopterin-binding protein